MENPASMISGTKRSASWGAACDSCARAKARCLRSDNTSGAKCDRCQSLKRSCAPNVRKPRKKRQNKVPRVAFLEGRRGGLVESINQHDTSLSPDLWPEPTATLTPLSPPIFENSESCQEDTSADAPLPGFSTFARPVCTCQPEFRKVDTSPIDSDDALLLIYNNQLRSQFPFVVIPTGVKLAQLERSRPLLAKVIRMVSSVQCRRSMWGQSRTVLQHISDAVIMRSERSSDLLQGILVFLGYYHYYCLAHGQFNNLAHLLISMIGDMGLDRPTEPREKAPYLALDPKEPKAMTNEERRVLIGAWYMGSNAALSFNRVESPRYTKHHDQCLNELKDAAEYETDELLIHLVRIQHLTERIFQFNQRDQFVVEPNEVAVQETIAAAQLSAFQAELDKFGDSLPKKLKSNYLLSSHYHTARLRLLSPLLSSNIRLSNVASPPGAPFSLFDADVFDRHRAATSVLESWIDQWLSIPVCYYFYMPQPGYGHLIYAITLLARQARLSLLSKAHTHFANSVSSCASTNTARPVADNIDTQMTETLVLNALDSIASRFEAAREEISIAHGREWANDLSDLIAKTLRGKKLRIEKWSRILVEAMNGGMDNDGFPPGKGLWPTLGSVDGQEGDTQGRKDAAEWLFEQLDGPLTDGNYQENWLWGCDPLGIMYTDQGGSS